MLETAMGFFDACESGKGWEACRPFCHDDAVFSCQSAALADVDRLDTYAGFMVETIGAMPDATYELTGFAADEERGVVMASAIFKGTHTGAMGPQPPTGKSTASDYAYVMAFKDGRISGVTKIWNDSFALSELGWG